MKRSSKADSGAPKAGKPRLEKAVAPSAPGGRGQGVKRKAEEEQRALKEKMKKPKKLQQGNLAEEAQSGLHPSWAAKLKANAPVSFQGARQVFDDSD